MNSSRDTAMTFYLDKTTYPRILKYKELQVHKPIPYQISLCVLGHPNLNELEQFLFHRFYAHAVLKLLLIHLNLLQHLPIGIYLLFHL